MPPKQVDGTLREGRLRGQAWIVHRLIAADAAELETFCIELIEQRRAALRDDLLSALILENQDGDRLSTDELVSLIRSMIAAGIDTTRNQIGSLMALVVDDPTL